MPEPNIAFSPDMLTVLTPDQQAFYRWFEREGVQESSLSPIKLLEELAWLRVENNRLRVLSRGGPRCEEHGEALKRLRRAFIGPGHTVPSPAELLADIDALFPREEEPQLTAVGRER